MRSQEYLRNRICFLQNEPECQDMTPLEVYDMACSDLENYMKRESSSYHRFIIQDLMRIISLEGQNFSDLEMLKMAEDNWKKSSLNPINKINSGSQSSDIQQPQTEPSQFQKFMRDERIRLQHSEEVRNLSSNERFKIAISHWNAHKINSGSQSPDGKNREPSPYNKFMKAELKRLTTTQEGINLDHKQRFILAAKNWKYAQRAR